MRTIAFVLASPLLTAMAERVSGLQPPTAPPPVAPPATPEPAPLQAQGDTSAARRADAASRRSARLFGEATPLEIAITADFARVFLNRDTLSTERFPARLTVADTAGRPVTIAVEIAPRGHFRLKRENCSFPPLKIHFADGGARGTPFQGQNAVKLGTHCRPDSREYDEYVVREYAVYRIQNLITDVSLRARMARVTYRGEHASSAPYTASGLLIEDEDDAARRNFGRIAELRRGRFADVDADEIRTLGVFEYLIGNTDWSLFALHNIRLIHTPDSRILPLAYDFDHAGIVSARYAKPDYRLPIRTVQERLYLGPCMTAAELTPVLAKFTAQRGAMEAVYAGTPGLSPGYRRFARDYIGEFFGTVGNARRVQERIIDACPRDGR